MTKIMIVDDSAMDRRLARRMLEEIGLDVVEAEDGGHALKLLAQFEPDAVLTDIQMPEVDGLSLVLQVAELYPQLPVILMTAFGSEDLAVKALQVGAASYVPKQNLAKDLVPTIKSVLSVSRARNVTRKLIGSMKRLEAEYELENTLEGIDALIGSVKEQLRQMRLFGEHDILRIGTAVYEVIVNAIEHGNLEVRSECRDMPPSAYRRFLEDRSRQAPFRTRLVRLSSIITRSDATFVVEDEGPGFDTSTLRDPTLPENVGQVNGRGLFLVRTFMDTVKFNERGNVVTMVKQRTIT